MKLRRMLLVGTALAALMLAGTCILVRLVQGGEETASGWTFAKFR